MNSLDSNALVQNLLRGAVPERADEIRALWEKYTPAIEAVPDKAGVTMETSPARIQFDSKTVHVFWLLAFSAWRSIETYSPAIILAMTAGATLDKALGADQELGLFEVEYRARWDAAQTMLDSRDTDTTGWPPDIPLPVADREHLKTEQEKAAFDLACLALAFTFLHEFRHVVFFEKKDQPSERPEEEIACDVWARGFLTEKLASYASKHAHQYGEVLLKRSMGMALGAFIVYAITPAHGHWGTADYPPIADRIQALIGGTKLPDESHFWLFASSLLVGIMRRNHRPLDVVPASSKALAEELIDRLK